MSNLERRGVPIEKAIQEGRLNFTTGMDTPGEMIRYLAGFVEKTDKFRVMGDMSWALEKGWDLAALRALEKAADFMPRSSGRTLLCQYSLEDFSGAHVMMAAELHRQIIYKGRVEKSPYHNTHLPQRH
jgi:transcriptional repressor of dcmA and dcmR